MMFRRHLEAVLVAAMAETPVVVLQGGRQTGKTTLAKRLIGRRAGATYLSLDDPGTLEAARRDPVGLLQGLRGPVVIDEIQRAPMLARPLKMAVDHDRRPGRFLLTGSSRALSIPDFADALVGRMAAYTLRPLSQGELGHRPETFLGAAFGSGAMPRIADPATRPDLLDRIRRGGFPEAAARTAGRSRRTWFNQYVDTMIRRDIRDLARIEGLAQLPRLVVQLAGRASGIPALSDVARDAELPYATLRRYLALLEASFLVQWLPAWTRDRVRGLAKAPKLLMGDTGLMARLLEQDEPGSTPDPAAWGRLLENFVGMELIKQSDWHPREPRLCHFRTHRGLEVDFVLQDSRGLVVGIEVKATATPDAGAVRGLEALREAAGDRFHRGIVLCLHQETLSFGDRLWTMPISALWGKPA